MGELHVGAEELPWSGSPFAAAIPTRKRVSLRSNQTRLVDGSCSG